MKEGKRYRVCVGVLYQMNIGEALTIALHSINEVGILGTSSVRGVAEDRDVMFLLSLFNTFEG